MTPCYRVWVEAFFEAAHNLRSYHGCPEPVHGHSWKVEVEAETAELDAEGMALDFGELRGAVGALTKRLDHTYLNDVAPFTDLTPSAENIARWLHDELHLVVERLGGKMVEVRVWEGPHASAAYRSR